MSELADLLERFRRGGELLAVATTGAAGPELDFKPGPNKWSLRQIVCHVTDFETVLVMRLRMVAAEDNPTLMGFNGELWAEKLDYKRRKLSQAIETCRRLRTENFELLKELPESDFARTGNHTESGTVTLRDLVQHSAEHLEQHVKQIQAVRAAYREHKKS
jgi:DinB family protein